MIIDMNAILALIVGFGLGVSVSIIFSK